MVATYETKNDYKVVGNTPIRHDGLDKVTGRAVYGGDVKAPGLIWGEVLRSPHAHARIKKIDTSTAEAMDGVFAVLTHSDFPTVDEREVSTGEDVVNLKRDQSNIMANKKVHYKGHVVAAVAAVDRNTAQQAANVIKVEYEVLSPISNVDDAMADDAPIILEGLVGDHLGEEVENTNVATIFRHEFGDVDNAFANSDIVIERTVSMSMIHQGYIEPHNATAIWAEDGNVTVWSSTQGSFGVRAQTAGMIGVPESKVRVNYVEIGGGFGGKTKVYLAPVAALLSRKSGGRPVKLIMDRSSIFEATGPAPGGKIRMKIGATKDGKITAADTDIMLESGGYPGSAVGAAGLCVFACYNLPASKITGYDVLVNKPKSAAYRAPGSPQASFAIETVIDEICEKGGFDKIQFRLENAAKEGTRRGDGVQFIRVGLEECLESAKESDHWKSPIGDAPEGKARGRGVASAYWMNGGGKSTCDLMLQDDGTVMMNEGSADIGGTRTSIAMQAAEVLGIPIEDFHPSIPDTDSIGFTGVTGGSRTTYATGLAAYNAAHKLVDELKGRLADLWETETANIKFNEGTFTANGDSIGIQELAGKLDPTGGSATATASVNLAEAGNAYGVHICDLEVDLATGKTDVIRYTAIQDVGKAVHPQYAEGQIQGGVVQGLGWALNEEYFITDDGAMANRSFLDYRMPTSLDMPMIDTIMVEVPNPLHPYGVRGVGEVPISPPLSAAAQAIKEATGKSYYELPVKPGRILEALNND
ncbi:MAG: xanthine dehydrogenase family protein molybdopterin-binding subunit [SAR202 cluster bacterium]|nr:oxidoreductase [Chloroflexota bacterium]MQG87736.1 xanthine dehydrogenase family protein molybdopterin-binding subunit [SAR202 cluster bacterium]|tara:strand:- start:2282 stop:4552 length:2271 start_codon:yes stop_codon:yes gene_type:complete